MSIIGAWGFEGQDLVRDKLILIDGLAPTFETNPANLPSPGASTSAMGFSIINTVVLGFLQSSPSSTDFWMHGQWFFNDNNTENDNMVFGWQAGTNLAGYITRQDNTGLFQIVIDGSVVATGVTPPSLGSYTRIHVHVDYQNSGSGFVRVYLNGAVTGLPEVQFTGNTNPSAYGAIDIIRFRGTQSPMRVDDVVIMDPNDAVAPTDVNDIAFTTIGLRKPNGDGTDTAWSAVPGAGSDYEDIDEVPNNDSDYLQTTSTSQASTFDFENATFGSVLAVKVKARTLRAGTAAGTNIAFRQRLGATVTDTADITCPGDGDVHQILNTDANGSAWATLNYDNTEFGVVSKT
jgi:hypothetical protein